MCVQIIFGTSNCTTLWDHKSLTITVPVEHDAEHTLLAVRAVLSELGARQGRRGAICWCGEPVELPLQAIPRQSILGKV